MKDKIKQLDEFLLRRSTEFIQNAVMIDFHQHEESIEDQLVAAEKQLIEWAGRAAYTYGYKPRSSKLERTTADFGRKIGIGIFMECDKYDDTRCLLLTAYEQANHYKDRCEALDKQNNDLRQQLKDIEDKYGVNRGGLFDRFYEGKAVTDED